MNIKSFDYMVDAMKLSEEMYYEMRFIKQFQRDLKSDDLTDTEIYYMEQQVYIMHDGILESREKLLQYIKRYETDRIELNLFSKLSNYWKYKVLKTCYSRSLKYKVPDLECIS